MHSNGKLLFFLLGIITTVVKVMAAEDYMDNETLFSIICDLSVDPPDKASAKKEAKRLCLNDFRATLGNNMPP